MDSWKMYSMSLNCDLLGWHGLARTFRICLMRAISCRIPKEETQQGEQRHRRAFIGEALQRGKKVLPAVAGALIAAAAAIIFAQPAASAKVPSADASEASALSAVSNLSSMHGVAYRQGSIQKRTRAGMRCQLSLAR